MPKTLIHHIVGKRCAEDKKTCQQLLFAKGPIGVWVQILGPKASKMVGIGMAVLLIAYAGFRIYIGQ